MIEKWAKNLGEDLGNKGSKNFFMAHNVMHCWCKLHRSCQNSSPVIGRKAFESFCAGYRSMVEQPQHTLALEIFIASTGYP